MRHLLQRHPIPISTYFRRSLVVTYAFPSEILAPLLPPGIRLDLYKRYGFLAIALVSAERLRPSFLPAFFGQDVFLSGYRIFARSGASRRGLRILRSQTDRRWMVWGGNLLTRYHYRLCRQSVEELGRDLRWSVRSLDGKGDFDVRADLAGMPAALPRGSPFEGATEARRFAGPLPYTFDYEPQTNSLISIRGMREAWNPRPVAVEVTRCTFFDQEPFCRATPRLANAFYIENTPYRWLKGERRPLEPL